MVSSVPARVPGEQPPAFDVSLLRVSVSPEGPFPAPSRESREIYRPLPVASGCWQLLSGLS